MKDARDPTDGCLGCIGLLFGMAVGAFVHTVLISLLMEFFKVGLGCMGGFFVYATMPIGAILMGATLFCPWLNWQREPSAAAAIALSVGLGLGALHVLMLFLGNWRQLDNGDVAICLPTIVWSAGLVCYGAYMVRSHKKRNKAR